MHKWWGSRRARGCADSSWDEPGGPDYPTGHPGVALSSPKLPHQRPKQLPKPTPWTGVWGPQWARPVPSSPGGVRGENVCGGSPAKPCGRSESLQEEGQREPYIPEKLHSTAAYQGRALARAAIPPWVLMVATKGQMEGEHWLKKKKTFIKIKLT